MIGEDIDDQIEEEVSAIEETKVLLGLMREPQAKAWLERNYSVRNRWGPQLSDEEREEIIDNHREEWNDIYEEAKRGTADVMPFLESNVDLRDLPENESVQEYISEFKGSEVFQEVFSNVGDALYKFKLVPLESLIAYQPNVAIEGHQEIPTSDDGWGDVVRYCFPHGEKNYLHVDGQSEKNYATLRIVSRNPNINLHGPIINSIEERPPGNIAVTYEVRARPNFIQVANFNNRYILKNGYHRCYQLLQAGEEYVPAVVRYAQNYRETGAKGVGWFSRDMIEGPRPPQVRDFLTDAAVTLETKSRNKMIRFNAEKSNVER